MSNALPPSRWRRGAATTLLASAVLVMGGCAGIDAVPGGSCVGDADLTGIDWDNAQPVTVEIRDQDFSPMVFAFVRDRPYVLTISNVDSGSRTFRAEDFFRTVAVESATVAGEPEENLCFAELTVPPGGSAEVRMVALRDGRYDLTDGFFKTAFTGYESGKGFGAIYVE